MPVSSSPPHTSAVQCMHTAKPPHVLCLFVDWECIDLKLRKVLHKHMLAEGCISWMPAHMFAFFPMCYGAPKERRTTRSTRAAKFHDSNEKKTHKIFPSGAAVAWALQAASSLRMKSSGFMSMNATLLGLSNCRRQKGSSANIAPAVVSVAIARVAMEKFLKVAVKSVSREGASREAS